MVNTSAGISVEISTEDISLYQKTFHPFFTALNASKQRGVLTDAGEMLQGGIPRKNIMISTIAKYAGCHIYSTNDDGIYASACFVTHYTAYTEKHTLHFPISCSPYEVYERKFYDENISELKVFLHRSETQIFSLTGECVLAV